MAQGKTSILDKKIKLNNQVTTLEQALKIIVPLNGRPVEREE